MSLSASLLFFFSPLGGMKHLPKKERKKGTGNKASPPPSLWLDRRETRKTRPAVPWLG
jgi:hypothetical protein